MVSVLWLSLRVTEAQEEPTEQTQEQSLPSLLPLSIPTSIPTWTPTSIPTAQQREASPLPYSFPCISPSSRQGTVGPTILPGQFLFLSGKEPTGRCRRCKRLRFNPWIGKILWRKASQRLQCSCLENPMDRGAWRATVHGVAKSQTGLKRTHMDDFGQMILVQSTEHSTGLYEPKVSLLSLLATDKYFYLSLSQGLCTFAARSPGGSLVGELRTY